MLRKATNNTKAISQKISTDGDFNQFRICLMNGRMEKNANTRNNPEIVALELRSTHTGNCEKVAASGTLTSMPIATPLSMFPFALFVIFNTVLRRRYVVNNAFIQL